MVTKKRIRLEERDLDILKHVSRYRMTVLEVLQRMPFFSDDSPHAAKEAVRRLRSGGYLKSATLYRTRRYYHLTRTAANVDARGNFTSLSGLPGWKDGSFVV